MPERSGLWLISYDIACPRRLGRVARRLEKRGLRLQYSVFAIREKSSAISEIKSELAELIKPSEDDVRIYPIKAGSQSILLGASLLPEDMLPHDPIFQQLRLPLMIRQTSRAAPQNNAHRLPGTPARKC